MRTCTCTALWGLHTGIAFWGLKYLQNCITLDLKLQYSVRTYTHNALWGLNTCTAFLGLKNQQTITYMYDLHSHCIVRAQILAQRHNLGLSLALHCEDLHSHHILRTRNLTNLHNFVEIHFYVLKNPESSQCNASIFAILEINNFCSFL